jgi:hypothetical protein
MEIKMLDFKENENQWNFEVNEMPIVPQGMSEPIEGWKSLVRADTGTVLHVHRNSYHVLSHDDVVNSTYDSIKNANVSNDFNFEVIALDGGRKLQIDVLFNDIVTEPSKGDYVKYRVRGYNSYDGSWAYQTSADALRLWCLNGCTTPDAISKVWMRHTSQVSTESSAQKIISGLETFHNQKTLWNEYMKTPVKLNQAETFFKNNVTKRNSKTSEEKFNSKQLEILMKQLGNEFNDLGKNKWALYNCLTHWATHTDSKSSTPQSVTRNREGLIAKAMNTREWAEI